MNHPRSIHRWRGASLIELLIVIAVIVILIAIFGNLMTGTGGKEGVKQRAERQIQQVNFYTIYQGFYTYGSSQNEKYPATRSDGRMSEDTTSEVFGLLVEDGYLVGQQLISPNEYSSDIQMYTMGEFTPDNTSFCLNDYDANDWQRYRDWGTTQNSQYVLMSDRWFDDPSAPEGIHNLQADVGVAGYWNAMFGDGSTDQVRNNPVRQNDDHLFEPNPALDELDALMVRD